MQGTHTTDELRARVTGVGVKSGQQNKYLYAAEFSFESYLYNVEPNGNLIRTKVHRGTETQVSRVDLDIGKTA